MLSERDLYPNTIAPRDLLEIKKDFHVIKKIHSGGFFTVFEAHSNYLGSVCAVKIIPKLDANGTNKQPLIQNEIDILKKLKHAFIIRALNCEVYFHTTCIMLEPCDEGNLGEMVQQTGIPEHLVKRYILDIGTAIDYMKLNSVIHRDLKLDNILTSGGNVKVSSFGLAALASSFGLTYGDVGSPWAKAPEMLTQSSYNNKVDWWSLGIMLFTMVTGEKPFGPGNGKNISWHIINSPLRIPSHVSPACSEVIAKLLEKDPASRIGGVRELKSFNYFNGLALRYH